MARLKDYYKQDVAPALMKKFSYKSVMQIPKLDKVVVNVAAGEAKDNAKVIDAIMNDLSLITGQKPVVCRAKKSVANFKLREGMPIGAKVTLRGNKMWEFLDRLVSVALPRIRDFRGLSGNQFDGNGNYTFGLNEQSMFHEINIDNIDRPRGMDITVVTTATCMCACSASKFAASSAACCSTRGTSAQPSPCQLAALVLVTLGGGVKVQPAGAG